MSSLYIDTETAHGRSKDLDAKVHSRSRKRVDPELCHRQHDGLLLRSEFEQDLKVLDAALQPPVAVRPLTRGIGYQDQEQYHLVLGLWVQGDQNRRPTKDKYTW